MGKGQEIKTRSEPKVEIQERGEIFFFFRPKVAKEEAHGPDDVQRLYIVLRPESGERAVAEKQDPRSGKEGQSKSNNDGDDNKQATDSTSTEGGHGAEEVNIEKQAHRSGEEKPSGSRRESSAVMGLCGDGRHTTRIEDIKTALKGGLWRCLALPRSLFLF